MQPITAVFFLAVLTIVQGTITDTSAALQSDDLQDSASRVELLLQKVANIMARQEVPPSTEEPIKGTVLETLNRLYSEVGKELGKNYTQPKSIDDVQALTDEQVAELKKLMRAKLIELYDKVANGDTDGIGNWEFPDSKPGSNMEKLVVDYLSKKMQSNRDGINGDEGIDEDEGIEEGLMQTKEEHIKGDEVINEVAADFAPLVQVGVSNEYRYLPIFKFDGSAQDYCYPGWPSKQNDEKCNKNFDPSAPVFFQLDYCDGYTIYTYWLWYGLQRACIFNAGRHGNDWEHVSVYVDKNGQVAKVVFFQHNGHYTRRRGSYSSEGERPIVFIGKVAHGSYHDYCNGRCSWSEFFGDACIGSHRYCQGGCAYWDDFRSGTGRVLRDATIHPLNNGQKIDDIDRPDRDVCCLPTCKGSGHRALANAGCWLNSP